MRIAQASTRTARSPTCGPTACRWRRRRSPPRARRSPTATTPAYVPDKPRQYQTKAKNAQEAHEAIRPTDFDRTRAGIGDHARLYELIWKRALASQMASARLERTTVELADGTGQNGAARDRPGRALPRLSRALRGRPRRQRGRGRRAACRACARAMRRPRRASRPSSISPSRRRAIPKRAWSSGWRNSASAGRRPMPRPSQTLKDRDYVRIEKNRFFPRRAGGW